VNTNFILDGASGRDDKEYLDFQNPSAQNQNGAMFILQIINRKLMGFHRLLFARRSSKKITQLLDASSNWDKEAVSKMMVDNTSLVSQLLQNT
jgi:penicillin amidase